MENLSIIITGQLRTFFLNNNFTEVLKLCIHNYDKILIICVLNSNNQNDYLALERYFSNFKIHELILINYSDDKYQTDFITKMNYKYKNEKFLEIRQQYMELNTFAHNEIYDPIICSNSIRTQFHQISIGIAKLIEYINQTKINFEITFKTRFDIIYPNNFYPHMPKSTDIFDILAFNDVNKELIVNSMKINNLQTLDDLIIFNKQNQQILPECRITNKNNWPISFGGDYLSNYISLEYIKNNNKNIIYSFGTFFEFGETKNMLIFKKLFDDFWITEPICNQLLYHYYSPEVQIMLHCLYNNITILMYKNSSFLFVR